MMAYELERPLEVDYVKGVDRRTMRLRCLDLALGTVKAYYDHDPKSSNEVIAVAEEYLDWVEAE